MKKINNTHSLRLPVQTIVSQYNRSPHNYIFYMNKRRPSFSIAYILKGSVTFYTPHNKITFREGEMHYVPYGIRYRSEWSGENGSEYISVYGYPAKMQNQCDDYSLQKINEFSNSAGYKMLLDIYDASKNKQDEYVVYQKFFDLFSRVRPYLMKSDYVDFSATIMSATNYIELHHNEPLNVPELAYTLGVSESTLYHLFKSELGTTPIRYYNIVRIEKVIADMGKSDSIEKLAYRHGFSSYSYFRELFKAQVGMTPRRYWIKNFGSHS